MLLNDKVAIVTGGGSGIGEATSIRFSREGAAVIVADMRFRKAEAVANQINDEGGHATAIEVDVSIAESVEALVDKTLSQYGRLDVMFNNAGTLRPGSVVDLEVDDWDLVMGVNVRSVFLGGKIRHSSNVEFGRRFDYQHGFNFGTSRRWGSGCIRSQ